MNRKRWFEPFILVGLAALLAGCGNSDTSPTPATTVAETAEAAEDTESAAALVNTAWEVESFGDTGDMLPVIPDTYPSLHFMLERYSGYTGCDWFVGVYTVEGNSLRMETPAATEYGCGEEESALMEQAATYMVSLENIIAYELTEDKLHLYTAEDQLLLTMVPLESLPFVGTTWQLGFFSTEPEYWQPHISGTLITAQFESEQLTGNAGCNDYTATYTRNEDQLVLGELSVGTETCSEPEGVMGQESEYLSMLATAGIILETARSIELSTADGTPLLLYHGR